MEDAVVGCVICSQNLPVTNVSSLPCGHTFHYDCILRWVRRAKRCPTCRAYVIPRNIVKRLYFAGVNNTNAGDVGDSMGAAAAAVPPQNDHQSGCGNENYDTGYGYDGTDGFYGEVENQDFDEEDYGEAENAGYAEDDNGALIDISVQIFDTSTDEMESDESRSSDDDGSFSTITILSDTSDESDVADVTVDVQLDDDAPSSDGTDTSVEHERESDDWYDDITEDDDEYEDQNAEDDEDDVDDVADFGNFFRNLDFDMLFHNRYGFRVPRLHSFADLHLF